MATTCTCCRGRRCVRVRLPDEVALDSALLRLRDKLARERHERDDEPHFSAAGGAPSQRRPWEMTRQQFALAAEPKIAGVWARTWATRTAARTEDSTPRVLGLTQSVLRREVEFCLRLSGGPPDGYRVRVPLSRMDLQDQPHRAFVEAAVAQGRRVPSHVLAEHPGLGAAGAQAPQLLGC